MAVIISSDHGESLGELGSYCEHGEADGIVTHIPMIFKWPGCARGVESRGFHYQLDLLPTPIDLLGGVPDASTTTSTSAPTTTGTIYTSRTSCST